MENGILYRLRKPAIILGIFSAVFGCVSSPVGQEAFMGEGFQSSLPNAGARVVVWGNHSGAVTRTLGWLDDHQIQGVDRSWIEKELTDPGFAHRPRREQRAKVLTAAKSVGASLVLFANVEDSQLGRKFDLMSFGYKRMKIIGVGIRGVKPDTGDVVFGAKVWNSEPLVDSEQIVHDLTTFALQKVWNESEGLLPPQQEVAEQEQQPEPVATSHSDETLTTLAASNSEEAPPLSGQQEVAQQTPQQDEVLVDSSYSAKLAPTREVFNSELDRSLPLQPKVVQQLPKTEDVSVASPYSEKMPPILAASNSELNRSPPLQPEVVQQTLQQEEVSVATSYSEEMSPTPEVSEFETVEPQLSNEDPSLGLQIASGALSVLYTPIKVVYAGLGGFMGGLAYLLTAGNEQVAHSVWDASLQGDYWLTAKHLQGEEAIHFRGESSHIDHVHQARLDEYMAGDAVTE